MARSKAQQDIPNPEAVTRHNIGVWRDMGYTDWQIGTALIRPRLATPQDFKYWGLRWSAPPPLAAVQDEKPPVDDRLTRLSDALDSAISGTIEVTLKTICRRAHIGSETFQKLCVEYPHLYGKWEEVKRLNRQRGSHAAKEFLRIGRARAEKLEEAKALVDQAIADGTPLSFSELGRSIGRTRRWLQILCADGYPAAHRLRDRLEAHNAQIKKQKQSA